MILWDCRNNDDDGDDDELVDLLPIEIGPAHKLSGQADWNIKIYFKPISIICFVGLEMTMVQYWHPKEMAK